MPNKPEALPSREDICRVLAEQLDEALLAGLFPGHGIAALRQVLSPPDKPAVNESKTKQQALASAKQPAVAPGRVALGRCRLFTDGASRGNPGHAGAGAVLYGESGEEFSRTSSYLGICTNNVAEYKALLSGLKEAKRVGCSHLALFLDSELVVRQLQGRYKVKHEQLQPLYQEACRLLKGFADWSVEHVPRSSNSMADSLANAGIDQHLHDFALDKNT